MQGLPNIHVVLLSDTVTSAYTLKSRVPCMQYTVTTAMCAYSVAETRATADHSDDVVAQAHSAAALQQPACYESRTTDG